MRKNHTFEAADPSSN